ncbi:MAG TPA: hypothetical protein VG963_00770 [Polyangiaceae bacterium]|nr:hypothetical protein [Polyangiaceae bacterium]
MQIQRVLRGIVLRSAVVRSVLVWSGALVSVSSLAHGHGLQRVARLPAAASFAEHAAPENASAPAPTSASSEALRQVVTPDLLSPQSGDDDGDDGDGDGDGDDGGGDDDGSEAQPL